MRATKQGGSSEYETARAQKEIFRAKTAKLNFERMSGELVPAKDVRNAAFEKSRLVRDSLLNIPARVSPILAAEKEAKKVYELLDKEIRQCLETLSSDLNRSTGGEQ